MPRFKDQEIQRLIKDVESRPELLDLTLTKLIKKCPYLVEAYNLRKEDDPKSKAAFQAFWSRLRKELARKLDQENTAATRLHPPQASLPVVAMPSMPGNQTMASHIFPPTDHNYQQLNQHYHAPAPMPVHQSVVNNYITVSGDHFGGDQIFGNVENHPPDAESLAKDMAERVTETLGPKIDSIAPTILGRLDSLRE